MLWMKMVAASANKELSTRAVVLKVWVVPDQQYPHRGGTC